MVGGWPRTVDAAVDEALDAVVVPGDESRCVVALEQRLDLLDHLRRRAVLTDGPNREVPSDHEEGRLGCGERRFEPRQLGGGAARVGGARQLRTAQLAHELAVLVAHVRVAGEDDRVDLCAAVHAELG